MDKLNNSFNAQQASSLTDAIHDAIHNALLGVRTMVPCEVTNDGVDRGGVFWYDLTPLLTRETNSGEIKVAGTIINAPAVNIRSGSSGLKLKYKKGDKVIVGVCDRDWSLIKENWERGNAQGYTFHDLSSAFIFGYLEKSPPVNYIDMTDDDNISIHNAKKLSITNETTEIKTKEYTVSSEVASLKSNSVALGNGVGLSVLLENKLLNLTGTIQLTGLSTPDCVATVTGSAIVAIGGGSDTVKATE